MVSAKTLESLTLYALGVISIKFLLIISMLCKTEWSWELRTWSHKMNLLDILSTSPQYFFRKWIEATKENLNFDLRVYRVKQRRFWEKRTSTGSEDFSLLIWDQFRCLGKLPTYPSPKLTLTLTSCLGQNFENFGKTATQECKKSTSGWRASGSRPPTPPLTQHFAPSEM